MRQFADKVNCGWRVWGAERSFLSAKLPPSSTSGPPRGECDLYVQAANYHRAILYSIAVAEQSIRGAGRDIMKKKILVGAVTVIALFAIAVKVYLTNTPSEASLRHLQSGEIVGFEEQHHTYAWLGIPFAKPPVGDLRWRAPRPVESWEGVRETVSHGNFCQQVPPIILIDTIGGEDCLYLDVWSPRLTAEEIAKSGLPVMVWIHGGANTLGMAMATRGYNIAGSQQVIVVALQYRLGILGWFSHPALRETAQTPLDATSNFALLDMIAALQWVRGNITQFGGDPDNVTIFGQSAGGFNVLALMAAPPANGLFNKAISQSGNIQTVPRPMAENYVDDAAPGLPYSNREFVNSLLVADGLAADREEAKALQSGMSATELADYLRGQPADRLFESVDKRSDNLGYFTPTNIRDGLILPHKPVLELFSNPGQYNRVPVMLGSNRDEYKFFLWKNDSLTKTRFYLGTQATDLDEYNRITRYFSDQWRVTGVNEPASALSRSQPGEVFAYRFDWAGQKKSFWGNDMANLMGAGHGLENTFVFGPDAVSGLSKYAVAEDANSRTTLGDAMRDYWAAFARTGEPGNGGNPELPVWQAWQATGNNKLILDRLEAGGIHMASDHMTVVELKQRIKTDAAIKSTRECCELFAQVFYYALTKDFCDEDEYRAMGCAQYPLSGFEGII